MNISPSKMLNKFAFTLLGCSLIGSLYAQGGDSWSATSLSAQLSQSDRPAEDKARDEDRKPGEVIAFLGINKGMTVLDMMASSGYYTEILANAVGKEGKVYAQNSPRSLARNNGAAGKALDQRINERNLTQISRLDRDIDALGLPPESLDAAFTALNFHDVYNYGGAEAAATMLNQVARLLKPGGIFGIVDHNGIAGQNNTDLHRIELDKVLALVEDSDFELEAQSDVLRNAADDHTQGVFGPLRGKTDRFVLKLRKKGST